MNGQPATTGLRSPRQLAARRGSSGRTLGIRRCGCPIRCSRDGINALELAELSARAAGTLSRTLRNLDGFGLVTLHRSPDTRAVHPEALAEFFVGMD